MATALSTLSLEEVSRAVEDPFAALNAMLGTYNIGHVGPANHVPLWLFARDAAGKVQGGELMPAFEPFRQAGQSETVASAHCHNKRGTANGAV
jgi:hypothetical protein